jgi:hypothetical protein
MTSEDAAFRPIAEPAAGVAAISIAALLLSLLLSSPPPDSSLYIMRCARVMTRLDPLTTGRGLIRSEHKLFSWKLEKITVPHLSSVDAHQNHPEASSQVELFLSDNQTSTHKVLYSSTHL